jgi:hypothetical protein
MLAMSGKSRLAASNPMSLVVLGLGTHLLHLLRASMSVVLLGPKGRSQG